MSLREDYIMLLREDYTTLLLEHDVDRAAQELEAFLAHGGDTAKGRVLRARVMAARLRNGTGTHTSTSTSTRTSVRADHDSRGRRLRHRHRHRHPEYAARSARPMGCRAPQCDTLQCRWTDRGETAPRIDLPRSAAQSRAGGGLRVRARRISAHVRPARMREDLHRKGDRR